MIPITTKEQFFEAKAAAEQMTDIKLFGATYLVQSVNFDVIEGRGEVGVVEVRRVIPGGEVSEIGFTTRPL
jgi:hypothetical protein